MLVDVSVEQGVEHELRVASVVAHLSLVCQPLAFLRECQLDGVDAGGVVDQRVEVHLSVDARQWRRVEVEEQFLEVNLLRAQQVGDGVVQSRLYVQLQRGQQSQQCGLVDYLIIILCRRRVYQGGALLQQPLVAVARVELHYEVAALYAGQRGVAVGAHEQSYLLGHVSLLAVGDVQVVQQSL